MNAPTATAETMSVAQVLAILRDLPRRDREEWRETEGLSPQESAPADVTPAQRACDEQWALGVLTEMRAAVS